MLRIAIIILLLVLILVALYLPRFRRAMGITLIVLTGLIGLIIWQDTQERDLEFERISVPEAKLSHMRVRPGLNSRSFVVMGRIQNIVKNYTILSVRLQATVKDCETEVCEIVGQEHSWVQLNIPPEQSRDFSVTIPFPGIPEVKGEAVWTYDILQVRAR